MRATRTNTSISIMKYKVTLRKTDEGFSVSCPGLPGCWSEGQSEAEALDNIKTAIEEYLAVAMDLANEQGAEVREVEVAARENILSCPMGIDC